MKNFFILIFVISLTSHIQSERVDEDVLVKSLKNWDFKPSTKNISYTEIDFLNPQHGKELLNTTPGVWLSRGSGQESLMAIRSPVLTGSGSCGSFQFLEDDLPIRPNGFCNVNIFFELPIKLSSGLDVVNGPSSSKFGGNALHGLINLNTIDLNGKNLLKTEIDINESFKAVYQYGKLNKWSLGFTLDQDKGYRDASGFDQQKIVFKNKSSFNEWEIINYFSLSNLNQETAGYISSYNSDIRFSNSNPEAYRDAKSFRYFSNLSSVKDGLLISFKPYLRNSSMKFIQHYLPGKPIESNSQVSLGLSTEFSFINLNNHQISLGIQVEEAKVKLNEFQPETLTTSSPFNNALRPKGFHYDFEVDTLLVASNLSYSYLFRNDMKFFSNLRAEYLSYDYDNLMLSGRTRDDGAECIYNNATGCFYSRPEDQKINFNDTAISFGISKQLASNNYFIQLSSGFRPPQINELFRLQKAQLVTDLDSENINSFEFGINTSKKGFNNKFVFFLSYKNDYIYKDSGSNTISGGKSKHQGIELSGTKEISEILKLHYNFTLAEHKYNYSDLNIGVIKGNLIDTAPKIMGSFYLDISPLDSLTIQIEEEFMGKYYTEPTNAYSYDGHFLTNIRGRYNLSEILDINFSIFNIFNKRYAERADFTNFSQERYFPGLPIQWRFGFSYKFD